MFLFVVKPQSLVTEQDSRPSLLEGEEQVNDTATDASVSNKKTDEVAGKFKDTYLDTKLHRLC